MAFSERIRLVIDVATGNSASQIGKLRTELSNTEGAFGKMRVAGAGAFDLIKQNAATFATAAGASLVAFGTKAVNEFQSTALGAGKLRDALGVTAEEASRLQEVAGDLGINVGSLESSIGRMNRTASTSPGVFDDIGAAIVRNADGTINVSETFIAAADAISRIPDAADRAAAAQKIFGRGWQDIAELIAGGAEGIREAMESVEDAKIIDDGEIRRAREFRDTLDELKGVMESLSLEIGGDLVETFGNLKSIVEEIEEALGHLPGATEETGDQLMSQLNPVEASLGRLRDTTGNLALFLDTLDRKMSGSITGSVADLTDDLARMKAETEGATYAVDALAGAAANAIDDLDEAAIALEAGIGSAAEAAAQGLRDVEAQWDELTGALDANDTWRGVEEAFDDLQAAAVEALNAVQSGSEDAEGAVRDHEASVDDLKRRVIDYAREVASLPPEQVTDILAQIDEGKYAEVEQMLANLEETRRVTLLITGVATNALVGAATGGATSTARTPTRSGGTGNSTTKQQKRAAGGPVGAGEGVIVGDRFGVNSPSAEVFVPDRPGSIVPLYPRGPSLTATVDDAAVAAIGAAVSRSLAGMGGVIASAVAGAIRSEGRQLASTMMAGRRHT